VLAAGRLGARNLSLLFSEVMVRLPQPSGEQ